MSLRHLVAVSLVSITIFVLSACNSSGGEIPEADSVLTLGEALEAAGLRVNGPLDNDFLSARYFSIPGVQFDVSGEMVLAYEFDTDDEVTTQRELVSPDGWGIGSKYINWTVGPNYYQNGRLLVVYDGEEQAVLETLNLAMGQPFSSGNPA